jgi:hypothetical protein
MRTRLRFPRRPTQLLSLGYQVRDVWIRLLVSEAKLNSSRSASRHKVFSLPATSVSEVHHSPFMIRNPLEPTTELFSDEVI